MAALPSRSAHDLSDAFSRLSLNDSRYPSGHVISQPLAARLLRVDRCFMESGCGRALARHAKWIMAQQWISSSWKLVSLFNQYLDEGTCCGEAQVFILCQRPTDKETLMAWPQEARTQALVFQLFESLPFQVFDDAPAQIALIKKERNREVRVWRELDERISRLDFLQRYYQQEKAHASKNERRRLTIAQKKNGQQFERLRQEKQTLYARILKKNSKIEELEEKVEAVAKVCTKPFQHMVTESFARAGLRLLAEESVGMNCGNDQFHQCLRKKLSLFAKNEAASDLEVILHYVGDPISHVIVIQPKACRIYDSNVGVVSYADFSHLTEDFLSLIKREKVCCVTFEVIGKSGDTCTSQACE
jgi:hypothetical protein